jgi:hypothetical protein
MALRARSSFTMSTNSFTGSLSQRFAERRAAARVSPRPWWHDALSIVLIALVLLLALVAIYRVPQEQSLDIGSSYARAHLRGFYQREQNTDYSYAFTGDRAEIFVPGVGGGTFATSFRFDGVRPADVDPARVTIGAANDSVTFAPSPGLRDYRLLVPAPSGDISVRIATNAFQAGENDPRQLGIPLDRFAAQPATGAIPWRATALLLALGIGFYALARRLAFGPLPGLLMTLLIVGAGLYGLQTARLLITIGLLRWLVVLIGLHVALWPLRRIANAIYTSIGLPLEVGEERWLWRIFAAATLVKLGGILYPHAIIFDQAAHVLRMQWLLDGRFMELYRPGYTSYMGDTVGLGGGQFPYSPLWYLIVAPFRFLGIGLPDATNGLSALMDVSKLFPIHIIARRTTGSRRAALYGAALYHLIPMPYFLLSWGNYPTQFGLWAALLATAFVVIRWDVIATWSWRQRSFWVWVGLMALAILSYTVLGVYSITFFVLLGLFGLFARGGLGRKRFQFLIAGMVAAELFCFAIYHVQFAQALVMDTLPSIVSGTADRLDNPIDATAEARENPLANFAANNQFTTNHFTWPVLILSAAGAVLLFRNPEGRRWWPLWAAWIGIWVLYTLVSAYIADMVLKHVFWIMPLIAIWTAAALDWLWQRRWWGQAAVVTLLGFLLIEVAQRGHFYLLVKRHFT